MLVPLCWAVYRGFKDGIVVQLGGLAGLLVGVYLAFRFGSLIGRWLDIESPTASIAGFCIVLVVVIIGVALLSRGIRGLLKAAGVGMLDKVGGALLSVLKMGLILGLLIYCFDWFNRSEQWVDEPTLDRSVFYRPLVKTAAFIFPYVDFVKDKLIDTVAAPDGGRHEHSA